MTISYKWLSDYLPVKIEPERLSRILTSIGLEVEKMEAFEEVKGGLQGLVVGEVLEAEQHPNADKLKLTKVNTGGGEPLQIVCGAPNVAAGQKVIVATVGTTIYPTSGDPLTMKIAKIRGVESQGMICAEDEIGLGTSHAGIMVLPADTPIGITASEYFKPYEDTIYEIGLTPNRMDAMSHWGVARDVCAYLSHHDKKNYKPQLPNTAFKVDNHSLKIDVTIENKAACKRYSGVCISGVTIGESPKWLQERLKSIGLRPINNIVDITNFIQHETGQPLHAFDYDEVTGQKVIVKNLPEGTPFISLDEKERKLSAEDLMICNGNSEGMCIAGVFGGAKSGVSDQTKNIFLESAYFDPTSIRKTSFRHGLRTDAAVRFEKGIDISNTVTVLKRAANLIKEIAGGQIASEVVDIYPVHEEKKQVILKHQYLKKLSGKNYHPDTVRQILESLGFELVKEGMDSIMLNVPFHKPDVSLPADIVEEILRIDGLDNIDIPQTISLSPAVEEGVADSYREKVANTLAGEGFTEILTNSITNSAYYSEEVLQSAVKLLNNLSVELDIMRPSMLYTALEVLSFNSNRKNSDLRFFEFGKTYRTNGIGKYEEQNHLCLYITGAIQENSWKGKAVNSDLYYIKGVAESVLKMTGVTIDCYELLPQHAELSPALSGRINGEELFVLGKVQPKTASRFDLKVPVFVVDFNWDVLIRQINTKIRYKGIAKYPSVERDLAMVVPKSMKYGAVKDQVAKLRLYKLQEVKLFDVFESEKIGADKKSLAVNFTFLDEEKTLTDKEIDGWMNKIMFMLEKELGAEIRK